MAFSGPGDFRTPWLKRGPGSFNGGVDPRKLFASGRKTLSFEFFPPKDEKGRHLLEDTILSLAPIGPDFTSVTDKVGGSQRHHTQEICAYIMEKTRIPAMAHLTCLGATRADLRRILDDFHGNGIRAVMALRGDPPKGAAHFTPTPGGCNYSGELIELVRADGRFAVGCASYPDGHPEAASAQADWNVLADKFKRGADFSVTQCFFDNDGYSRMLDHLRATEKEAQVIPGILPITNWKSVKRFCEACQSHVPPRLRALLDPIEDDPVACRRVGMETTIRQCEDLLLRRGAPGLHIYSLNRSTAAAEIVTSLRLLNVF